MNKQIDNEYRKRQFEKMKDQMQSFSMEYWALLNNATVSFSSETFADRSSSCAMMVRGSAKGKHLHFVFDPDVWDKLIPDERAFLMMHNIQHQQSGHFKRFSQKDRRDPLVELAMDLEVNHSLMSRFTFNLPTLSQTEPFVERVEPAGMLDSLSAEEYLFALREHYKQQQQEQQNDHQNDHQNDQQQGASGSNGASGESDEKSDEESSSSEPKNGKQKPSKVQASSKDEENSDDEDAQEEEAQDEEDDDGQDSAGDEEGTEQEYGGDDDASEDVSASDSSDGSAEEDEGEDYDGDGDASESDDGNDEEDSSDSEAEDAGSESDGEAEDSNGELQGSDDHELSEIDPDDFQQVVANAAEILSDETGIDEADAQEQIEKVAEASSSDFISSDDGQKMLGGRGNGPNMAQLQVQELDKQKENPWRLLAMRLVAGANNEHGKTSWLPNKRFQAMQSSLGKGMFLPSRLAPEKKKIRAVIFLDTSYSCRNMVPYFWSLLKTIPRDIFEVTTFTHTNIVSPFDEKRPYFPSGGTSYRELEQYFDREDGDIKYAFVFSDGDGDPFAPKNPRQWHFFMFKGLGMSTTRYLDPAITVHDLKDYVDTSMQASIPHNSIGSVGWDTA